MKILVVEDDYAGALLLRRYLEAFGDVDTADNGKDAVQKFQAAHAVGTPYQLICLDIMLPVMSGQEALITIRSEETRMGIDGFDRSKILMVTALSEAKQIMASFREQCDGYVTKPVFYDKLMTELEKLGFQPLEK